MGRELQVHARLSEEYIGAILQGSSENGQGSPALLIILSEDRSFRRLAALTDVYIPDVNLWIGDYPYLDRAAMEDLLATRDDLWDLVQQEAGGVSSEFIPKRKDIIIDSDDEDDRLVGRSDSLVPVSRRRRRR